MMKRWILTLSRSWPFVAIEEYRPLTEWIKWRCDEANDQSRQNIEETIEWFSRPAGDVVWIDPAMDERIT